MALLTNFGKINITPYFPVSCTVLFNLSRITCVEIIYIYIYNSDRTSHSRSTQYVSIMKTNRIMLFTGKIVFIVKVTRKK